MASADEVASTLLNLAMPMVTTLTLTLPRTLPLTLPLPLTRRPAATLRLSGGRSRLPTATAARRRQQCARCGLEARFLRRRRRIGRVRA